jgi:hypothetical protein
MKFTAIYGQIRQGTLAIRRDRKAAQAMKVRGRTFGHWFTLNNGVGRLESSRSSDPTNSEKCGQKGEQEAKVACAKVGYVVTSLSFTAYIPFREAKASQFPAKRKRVE